MATTTQEKFFTVLQKIADEANLDLVNNRQYANTGTFRLEPKDGFGALLSVHYQFNDDYSSFDSVNPRIADRQDGTMWPYVLPDEIGARVLDHIREYLKV